MVFWFLTDVPKKHKRCTVRRGNSRARNPATQFDVPNDLNPPQQNYRIQSSLDMTTHFKYPQYCEGQTLYYRNNHTF
jgi:hypothetical protein